MRRTGAGIGLLIAFAAIAAVVATAAGAAASPLTKVQYAAMVKTGTAQVGKAERAMQLGLARKAPQAEMKRLILAWAAAEKRFGESLKRVRPPRDAVSANALLARGEITNAGELGNAADKLPSSATAVQTYLGRVLAAAPGGAVIIQALSKLRIAGYF